MRILLITASYAPILGGLQTIVQTLAESLTKRGHIIEVVSQRYPRSLPSKETICGVSVRRWLFLRPRWFDLKHGRFDLYAASFVFFILSLFRLMIFIARFKPEIVNIHFPDCHIPFVLIVSKLFRFKLITSLHGNDVERFVSPKPHADSIKDFCLLLQKSVAVTVCSSYLRDCTIQVEPKIREKIFIVYNGIDLDRFDETSHLNQERNYFFSFGRMHSQKGFDLLIRGFAKVAELYPEVDLLIAGEGEHLEALKALIAELGLIPRVRFFGRANPAQLVRLLNGCEFVVITSRYEPFGITALEALAAGKYVIASAVGGLKEVLNGTSASLIDPDPQTIAENLAETLNHLHEFKKKGIENRSHARRFSLLKMVDTYQELYKNSLRKVI